MPKEKYLNDDTFLTKIDNLRIRKQVTRITVLDFNTEARIEDITGRISAGNISINGDSAVRRTATLTFIIDDIDNYNLFKVKDLLSLNKKIKLEIGIENTLNQYTDDKIIWFPQGIYIINNVSLSYTTGGITASIQLKDKMCLLNGDCGGVFPAQVRLDEATTVDDNGIEVSYNPTMYEIIQEVVNHFGGEKLGKIIINDVGKLTYQTMQWVGSDPLYVIHKAGENHVFTQSFSTVQAAMKQDKNTTYTKYEYGSDICYTPMDFVYPSNKEFVASAGSTVTSVLDDIKNLLGNFEYFYDLDGNFVFQEIKNYLNTSQATLINKNLNEKLVEENDITKQDGKGGLSNTREEAYYLAHTKGKSVYKFNESPLIISYNVNPKYTNIKNDFVIWGTRKNSQNNVLIRYHLVIDDKPDIINFQNIFVYKGDDNFIRAQVPFNISDEYPDLAPNITNINIIGEGTAGIVYEMSIHNKLAQNQNIITSNTSNWVFKGITTAKLLQVKSWSKKKREDFISDEKYLAYLQDLVNYIDNMRPNIPNEYKANSNKSLSETKLYSRLMEMLGYNIDELVNSESENTSDKKFFIWDAENGKYVDITNNGVFYKNYTPSDWRTVLYLQGSAAMPYGTDSNYYYSELVNEWPRLYDLRPKKSNNTSYSESEGPWYKAGKGDCFWPELEEHPEDIEYFLDFINSNASIGEFSINRIGRRQKVETANGVNCIFEPLNITDTVAIEESLIPFTWGTKTKRAENTMAYSTWEGIKVVRSGRWGTYTGMPLLQRKIIDSYTEECENTGRVWTAIPEDIYNNMAIGNSYSSAFEAIRSNLEFYTDYNESLSIICVPILHLEPNTRVSISNKNLNIDGDYMISSMSIPLGAGNMTMQLSKVIEKI